MPKKQTDIFTRKKVKESVFLEALENISKRLIYKFKFGYHEIEDMKQQAAIFALEGLEQYDNIRPLENFLWTHVRNRLFNFKRNNYFRPESVCTTCPFFDPKNLKSINQCSKFTNKEDCDILNQWISRNTTKRNLMHTNDLLIETHSESTEAKESLVTNIENNEIIHLIEGKLESQHRATYLKLRGGAKVPKQDLIRLQNHIKEILLSNNIEVDNYDY